MLKIFIEKMRIKLISILKSFFGLLGIGITSKDFLDQLRRRAIIDSSSWDLEFLKNIDQAHYKDTMILLNKSRSQLRQDMFVLHETRYKRGGYFVEFGATNGIDLSNTYLLETEFSWKGILAEPAKVWTAQLRENRPKASIETLCLWKDSNSTLTFNETVDPNLSTVDIFSDKDVHSSTRLGGNKYDVQTISLSDLLKKFEAPKCIDYLSIDTEGSEYEILKAFDFDEYNISIITIEHNNTSQRKKIFDLLTHNGYQRKYEWLSQFDDWYTKC